MNTPTTYKEERVVITGDKWNGGAFTEYIYKTSAAKLARFYRGRGYKVKTWTVEDFQQHLSQPTND